MTKISYTPRFLTSLSPTDNANNIEAYSKSLRWAIENRDIRNVALTGPYGSGKSSILKTFSKNASNKFLEISLATFKESIEPKDDKGSTNNLKNDPKAVRRKTQQHQLIELSILQQIFYKVDPNEIPYSRFKRISSIDRSSLNIQVFYAFLCLFGATIIFRPNFFARISWWEQFYTTYADGLFLLALVCIFPILLYFTRFTIKVLKNSRLNKFKISAAEIELSNADSSILNKHIDEILYFFERTDYDVVTIEDLDRFNDPEIFTKLREINNLINDSKQVGRKVTFIYAVKDDMFSDNARSKFFDFVIPVIPVIDTSNSIEKALENITQSGVNISNILLRDVCLYIHDMRILNNIFNEFYIYSDVLSEQTRHDKLFSLIVYKNMYPDDFALLHKNEGIVYQVFSTAKDEIISALNSAYLNKCLEIEKEIQSINNENIKDIETLTLIYSAAIFRKIDKALFIEIQNKKKRLVDITLGDLKWVRNQTDLYYYIEAGSNYGSATTRMLASISFSDIELQVDESQTLLSREQNILGKSESYINGKKYEAATLKKDLDKIKNKCLKDLLELNESSSLILLDFVIEKRLLFYLIRNRYIDETYSSTISNFYEGQFTLKDKSFLLSIKDRIPTDITLKLYKIDAIVEQLTDDDYSREAILNYSFVEYISNLEDFLPIRHKNIVEILSKQDKRSLDFLRGYLENVINKEKFIAHICKYWPSFVKFLIDSSSYTKQTIQEWVILIIKGADVKDIERQNEDSKLSNWISKSGDFLQHFNGENEVNRMHSIILRLGVKFEKLELTESIKAQLNFVYEKCLYKLNQYMIEQIVTNKNSISILHYDLSLANYTSIQSTNCEILKAYIADNIEEYLNCVFLQIDENTEESEETIIKLLSIQNDIEPETKQKIIAKENVKISNVASVDSVFWNELFNTSKVAPTWGNILKYYEEFNGVDESLANFLNKSNNYTILIKEKPDSSFIDLYKDVIVCPYISEDALRYYATFINHTFSSLVFGKLSEQKIDILLECNIIECNEDNFFELKDKFKDRQILLLEKNIGDFLRKHSVYDIDAHDYSLLLKSTILTVEDKRSLIELIDIDIFGKSPELAHILSDFLIRHGCNEIDSDVLKLIFPLIETQDRKVSLLISQIEKLSNEGILDILSNIGEPYSDLCRKGLHAKLPLSDTNGKLLVNLEIRDIISSFRQERDEFRIYLKRKK